MWTFYITLLKWQISNGLHIQKMQDFYLMHFKKQKIEQICNTEQSYINNNKLNTNNTDNTGNTVANMDEKKTWF